jgi:inhibitor of KinA sporulation pathway (predicted exonuclease)
MSTKKEPLFWSLDLEMEQPSNEIISVGVAFEYPTETIKKDFLITPSYPLSPFIQELTGLRDDMFDWNKTRKECFIEFYNEYYKFTAINDKGFKPQTHPITWGQGDLHLLRKQMNEVLFSELELPRRIVDVKSLLWFDKMVKGEYNSTRMSLDSGLKYMNLMFLGNPHNSADDAYNTLLLFRHLLYSKQNFRNQFNTLSDLL